MKTNLLTDILSDDAGNPSSMRLAMLGGLFMVLLVWGIISITPRSSTSLRRSTRCSGS